MKFLLDPRMFNSVITGLYVLAGGRYLWGGNWQMAVYSVSAAALTAVVTFGLKP